MRYFSSLTAKAEDGFKGAIRARQAWLILIGKAYEHKTVQYQEIASIMGYSDCRMLGPMLGRVAYYCIANDLPILTVLAVNHEGTPGPGLIGLIPANKIDQERERVFNYDWYDVCPPTAKRMQENMESMQENA